MSESQLFLKERKKKRAVEKKNLPDYEDSDPSDLSDDSEDEDEEKAISKSVKKYADKLESSSGMLYD